MHKGVLVEIALLLNMSGEKSYCWNNVIQSKLWTWEKNAFENKNLTGCVVAQKLSCFSCWWNKNEWAWELLYQDVETCC